MADSIHWAWLQPAGFPSFSTANNDNLGPGLNGTSVSTATYLEYGLRDLNGDGIVHDMDTDDGSTTAPGEGLVYEGVVYRPQEVAVYDNSTVVAGGVSYNVPLVVILSETGNWGVRILDGHFPPGQYPSDFTSATLGTFNGIEYDGANVSSLDDVLCFAEDAPIGTPGGWRAAGSLSPGDLVLTDRGAKPLVWTVRFEGSAPAVEIPRGAFGATATIRVSPSHNVLIRAFQAELLFGSHEVLVPASALVGFEGVRISARPPKGYVHLLCQAHEVLQLPGLWCESFRPGPWGVQHLPREAAASLHRATKGRLLPARYPVLKPREAATLLASMSLQRTGQIDIAPVRLRA